MNSLIEALNVWGDHALRFAWPMLWQSSLLIALLFALDLLTRRKLRPAVRYALWLVVLVKLLLPPSLAFPTGPGWWLRQAKAAPARPRPATTVVVTYDAHDLPAPSVAPAPVIITSPPPRLRLTPASWTLVGMAAVSLGLLAWMLVRWLQVTREARRSPPAPAVLNQLFPEQRRPVRLKLTDRPMSPAVCGLFRPVILLPRTLVDRLPPAHLRAVLLHELLHLRRGDVWVNCAQALLQITYWWHPLLWLANARIRRLREEAVDDAVMLALKEEAETYAPTLLEVAKLALHRPLATLGLVGILESRSSLRQRIERLIDFHPPRKAGLTLGSALAVLGFAALAVPMGEAPPPRIIPESADSLVATNTSGSTALPSPGLAAEEETESSTLVSDGKLLHEMGKLDEAEAKLTQTQPQDAAVNEAVYRQANRISLRQKLAEARAAEDRYALASAAKLYDDAWGYAQKIGSGVDTERDQTIAGLAAVRLELARAAQHRGDYKEAQTQVDDVLRVDPTNAAAVEFESANEKLLAEQRGKIPSEEVQSQVPAATEDRIRASTLVRDGKLLYEMGNLDEAEAKLKLALKTDPRNEAANYYLNRVAAAQFARAAKLHSELSITNPHPRTNLVYTDQGRQAIITKLDSIRLESVLFDSLPLSEVVRLLADESRKRDPEKLGINFLLSQNTDNGTSDAATLGAISIKINPPLTDMRLADVLDVIVKVADRPIKYAIEDYAIVFSLKTREATPLYIRSFKIDPNTLIEKLHVAKGSLETNVSAAIFTALRDYLTRAGADLDPKRHPGIVLFYSERLGNLMIRATLQDLDIVNRAIAALGVPTEQTPAPGAARQSAASQAVSEAKSGVAKPIKRELVPAPSPYARTNVVFTGQGRLAVITQLDRIRLDSVSFDRLPLPEVVRFLADETRKRDPEQRGINFLLNQDIVSGANAAAPTLGPDGHPLPAAPAGQVDMNAITIEINPPLTNIRLADLLDAIVKVADHPIKYSIEDYAIVFSTRDPKAIPLYVRSFKVDPSTLARNLAAEKAPVEMDSPKTITRALVNFFKRVGVDLDPKPNPGKSIFFNDRQGTLLVRATLQDLDIIEVAMQTLTFVPQQINLKCKIVEVSQDDTKALGFDWYLGNVLMNPGTNSAQVGTAPTYTGAPTAAKPLGVFPGRLPHGTEIAPGGGQLGVAPTYSGAPTAASPLGMFPGSPPSGSVIPSGSNSYLSAVRQPGSDGQPFTLTGILTDPQYRMVIKALQQRNGAEFLAKPEVTTLSGRQAQCKSMSVQTVVKGISHQALTAPGITSTNDDVSAVFETETMEFGPILNVVPTVMADGYTINLPVDVTVLGFAGYDDPGTNRVTVYLNGKQKWVAPPRPKVQKREVAATVNVWDGQTLVLGGLMSENIIMMKDKVPVLGDLPLMGRFFRSESKTTQKRNLLVFITPTIIDPAGNRVHSGEEIPSAGKNMLSQPER